MLNGPALLRVFLVVIAAATLTWLVQRYWIFDTGPTEPPAAAARPYGQGGSPRRAETAPARPLSPAPQPKPAAQAASAPQPAAAASEPSPATPPETQATAFGSPPPGAPSTPVPPPQAVPAPAAAQPRSGEGDIAAAEATDPRAVDLVDLNTGSLSELNGLKGGGAIGRTIIQHRPYASTDQLLSKRVLSRAVYQRVKDQVTVR